MAGIEQARDRDARVGDAADRADEAVGLQTFVRRTKCRMDEQRRLAPRRGLPERIEVRIVEHALGALRLGADHRAAEAGVERLLQHLGRVLAGLQRHGRKRHEKWMGFHTLEQVLVEEPAPVGAFVGRNVIAEHVEPAADDLLVDAAVGEPFAALVGVAHAGRHRPLGIVVGEGETKSAVLDRKLHRRKRMAARRDVIQECRGHVVGMRVDDHDLQPPDVSSRYQFSPVSIWRSRLGARIRIAMDASQIAIEFRRRSCKFRIRTSA